MDILPRFFLSLTSTRRRRSLRRTSPAELSYLAFPLLPLITRRSIYFLDIVAQVSLELERLDLTQVGPVIGADSTGEFAEGESRINSEGIKKKKKKERRNIPATKNSRRGESESRTDNFSNRRGGDFVCKYNSALNAPSSR